ncbi:MAG: ARMT1-like domain-containing protein [Candidatus Zixiibacteriota bacterium]
MKTYIDCIPCFIRQALDAARFVTDDEKIHEQVLREVLRAVAAMDYNQSPPLMGQIIHRLIRGFTGIEDPYSDIKTRYNRYALNLYHQLKKQINDSVDPLQTAVRLAIAGNIIDFGARRDLDIGGVYKAIDRGLKAELDANVFNDFKADIEKAKKILYVGDNSGEIVFDRLLIETLPREKITFVVRGKPVLNDAVLEDARTSGVTSIVPVIDTGSDAPGVIFDDCSDICRQHINQSDLIIAKGQGNYETLYNLDKPVYYLFMAKCRIIAGDAGVKEGDIAFVKK